jgi:hypothetical protein
MLGRRTLACCAVSLSTLGVTLRVAAEEEPENRQMTQTEIESWLDSEDDGSQDVSDTGPAPEAPPPPPRDHGFVIQSSVGGIGHLGPLREVSPTSPEFRLTLGYEFLDWFMLLGQTGLVLSSTRYANPPPGPRSYAYYSFGGGLRFTFGIAEDFALYLQGELGAGRANDDVLINHGYLDSTTLSLYYGGRVGFEWYQVNPHLALGLDAGVTNYVGLERELSTSPPLALQSAVSIKYTF